MDRWTYSSIKEWELFESQADTNQGADPNSLDTVAIL